MLTCETTGVLGKREIKTTLQKTVIWFALKKKNHGEKPHLSKLQNYKVLPHCPQTYKIAN